MPGFGWMEVRYAVIISDEPTDILASCGDSAKKGSGIKCGNLHKGVIIAIQ